MNWRKATYSSTGGESCVEVASDGSVYVRDTKQDGRADRTIVAFAPGAWARFTAGLK
jgi:hypothetical protein